jgi:aspartyl-tRNA synthetase
MANASMATGGVEVAVRACEVLNTAARVPFPPDAADDNIANDAIRQRYRYLDLRRPALQRALRVRSELAMLSRRLLADRHGFVEVETPTLFKRTPGGAAEFPVPTQNAGQFYSLVQSPQQFKQLLMVGGLDR